MGNYRQHITFASILGGMYAAGAWIWFGVHWFYGTVATLLTTLSGLLPDLDSASGVELKGFTGILGVLAALAVWDQVGHADPKPMFELHLWCVVITFVAVRHGLRRIMARLAKHRGISHSLPTCAVWGLLTYLYYPGKSHSLKVVMALAVMVGFFSHLLLDEVCSVDLRGVRVNKAFGTAIKLWAPNPWTTLAMYSLLSYLTWMAIQRWPVNPTQFITPTPDIPFERYTEELIHKLRQVVRP